MLFYEMLLLFMLVPRLLGAGTPANVRWEM
jgi:hypothetical protein